MRKQSGFTLIELLFIIAILGIMAATAIPAYNTYRQRTIGTEAQVMLMQILNAEIIYFLEHDTFFPENNLYIVTTSGMSAPAGAIDEIRQAVNVHIPIGHKLDFIISATANFCTVSISSPQNSFALFGNGDTFIRGMVDKTGEIDIF